MLSLCKSKFFWPVLLFILIIPAFSFLLQPHMYFNMHDDMQMIRQLEIEKCLKDGQIPCRWTPDLGYGYGYPLFNFYPPMPYIVGEFFRLVGFTFMDSVKMSCVVIIIASAFAMYLLASSLFGPLGGLLSALFYVYAPYHAVNIYIRGAMNEAWAAVFFPLIFYFSWKLILKPTFLLAAAFSLSFAGLLLSHNPMAMTFAPILFVWCLYWFISRSGKINLKNILKLKSSFLFLLFASIFSLALTAYFTIPVLLESKYVQIESMFTGYYHFSVHFTSLRQLFISNFWGDGASVWGQDDGMSFMVGYLHWILPLLIIVFTLAFTFLKRKFDSRFILPLIIALMGFFTAFMTHERSAFLWLIFTPVQKIQFPWRFLNHTAFLMSLSVGIIPLILSTISKNKFITYINYLIIVLLLVLNLNYFHPLQYGPLTDEQKFSGKAWTNEITSGIYDYLPKTARIAARGPAKPFVDEVNPLTDYQVTGQKQGTDWMIFTIKLAKNSDVTLSTLVFPNLIIKDNYKDISYKTEPELGRPVVSLTAGEHQIYIKHANTPVRLVTDIISLISWVFLLIFLVISWKQSTSKK